LMKITVTEDTYYGAVIYGEVSTVENVSNARELERLRDAGELSGLSNTIRRAV
jgi:hypothetical protein